MAFWLVLFEGTQLHHDSMGRSWAWEIHRRYGIVATSHIFLVGRSEKRIRWASFFNQKWSFPKSGRVMLLTFKIRNFRCCIIIGPLIIKLSYLCLCSSLPNCFFAFTWSSPPSNFGCLQLIIELTPGAIEANQAFTQSQELFTMNKFTLHHCFQSCFLCVQRNILVFFEKL